MTFKKLPLLGYLSILLFATNLFGQQTNENQTVADETFEVKITDKKIVENSYQAKVELAADSQTKPPVAINIGAAVRADQITLTLKNIFGDVRFRGSLEKILNQINLRRPPNN